MLLAVLIMMSIIIAGLSSLALKLSFIDPETKYCNYGETSKTDYLHKAITIGIERFYSGIPGVLVFAFNVAILHSLRKHVSKRNTFACKSNTIVSSTHLNDTSSVTIMLVTTSFMLVIFRTPFFLLDLMLFLFPISAIVLNLFSVTRSIDWFDHSANLLVYCASSSVFRSKVKDAMCCRNN